MKTVWLAAAAAVALIVFSLDSTDASRAAAARPSAASADCANESLPLTPLTDLGRAKYRGYMGGLYPGGRNTPSRRYLSDGLRAATALRRSTGPIVLLSIGMSNATQEFSAFKRLADADADKNGRVVLVDGAQTRQDARLTRNPAAPYWGLVEQRLLRAGVTSRQVRAVWLKQAISGENRRFPRDAKALRANLRAIVGILRARFPQLRLVYLSSRTYAGYAVTPLNPEPFAYQSAFAVRWLIQDRIERRIQGPWLGWGPYLWTNGASGRRDGFVWLCPSDVLPDGTHPSVAGRQKVAAQLLKFFKTDPTARPWFVAPR